MVRRASKAESVHDVAPQDALHVISSSQSNLKYLYREVLLDGAEDYKQATDNALHDMLFDFLRWDELKSGASHPNSCLKEYLPDSGAVRWIYWPVMGEEPEIYEGDEHELAEKWKSGALIKGILVRIAGTGHNKYCLLPRFHLKTEIAHVAFALQEIIRDPSIRIMSKTHTRPLASKIIDRVKNSWNLEKFSRYFGELKPQERESAWNEQHIQVRAPRRGVGFTVESSAVECETVGSHPDLIILDDVIGFENLSKKEKVREHVESLAFVLGGEGRILGIGTRYAPDDPHGLFLDHGTPLFGSTSFIFATVVDEHGQPIWDYMNGDRITRLRERCTNEFLWHCQMYNNPYQVESQRLRPEWWRKWPRPEDKPKLKDYLDEEQTVAPELLAEALKLDITITLDPASSTRKKSDYSACVVQGQSQDREYIYLLDGFRERLSRDDLPSRFIDVVEHWLSVARRARVRFVVGVEDHGLGTYLSYPLKDQMRRRGISVELQSLKSANRNKNDRIYRLASPYKLGSILFPTSIKKDGYDLVDVLKHQYLHFPRGGFGEDDVLDAQAYHEDLIIARPMAGTAFTHEGKKILANDIIPPQAEGPASTKGLYVPKKFMHGVDKRVGRWIPGRFRNG